MRKIIHIDMDAFYASIEQRDNPMLKGKPVIVGGLPQGRGGVVATASYEARRFGVRSAMPSKKAIQLCPHAIFIRPRFEIYQEVSAQIRAIFARYTDLIEPLSLDEAFLDVSDDKAGIGSAIEIAERIRKEIREELHLTASAGISVNKFVAKIASDLKKPDGQTFIGPSRIERFMEGLPIEKFHGVGKVTAEKMRSLGLFTGADVKKLSEAELVNHFGKSGKFFYQIVRGIDDRDVEPNRETKSIGAEDTFPKDLMSLEEMVPELEKLAMVVHERLKKYDLKGKTVTLKIKFHNFKLVTRSLSIEPQFDDYQTISAAATGLLEKTFTTDMRIRLLGISVSNFQETAGKTGPFNGQLNLF
ncbi:MAG TPA: DNA polymerase IV [Chryseosolibacter sp.]|nr:DNA polymerase IV [Chryseosolibacter sp.]